MTPGCGPCDVDGITSYQGGLGGDSTTAAHVGSALGLRFNYASEMLGGGSATEMLVAHAIGLIEGGYCKTMAVFRSMNGRSGRRYGGQAPGGPVPATPAAAEGQFNVTNGFTTPAQMFGVSAMRYLRDFGATTKSFAEIAVAHRYHASLNPKALMRAPITIEDHQRSRWVAKPFRLLDCCLETDVASVIIVTSRERAYDLKHPPVFIMGGNARTFSPSPPWNYSRPEIHYQGGNYARQRMLGMAGVTHKDIDLISCYDAFTFTTLIQLEAYGFCGRGEAHEFVKGGRLQIDHELPCNTGGGHLSEGYTHGLQPGGGKRAPIAPSRRRRLSGMGRGQAYLRPRARMPPGQRRPHRGMYRLAHRNRRQFTDSALDVASHAASTCGRGEVGLVVIGSHAKARGPTNSLKLRA